MLLINAKTHKAQLISGSFNIYQHGHSAVATDHVSLLFSSLTMNHWHVTTVGASGRKHAHGWCHRTCLFWDTEDKEQQLEKYLHKRNSIVFCVILRDVAISVHPLTVILIGLIKEKKKKKQLLRMMPCNMNKKKTQSKQAKNVWSSLNRLGSFWKQKGDCEDSWIQT